MTFWPWSARLQRLQKLKVSAVRLAAAAPLALLAGCGTQYRLFHPAGPVANSELHFTVLNTAVMMVIIIPTTILTMVFALRYRKSRQAAYDPSFSHSLGLELLMWGGPLVITVILTFCTYASVFAVNPADPLSLDNQADPGAVAAPLNVDVITTDWQWIFIYPDQHIATIDDLVVPQGRTVRLRLSSATVTNDFYIPQVAPMIDVMPGMVTHDAFRVNRTGDYEGFSADFSGAGFSWMQFSTRIVSPADFSAWVAKTQSGSDHLDYARFLQVAKPTINDTAAPHYFSNADPNLFADVDMAVMAGTVFPVPEDMDEKAPNASPEKGKANEVKSGS